MLPGFPGKSTFFGRRNFPGGRGEKLRALEISRSAPSDSDGESPEIFWKNFLRTHSGDCVWGPGMGPMAFRKETRTGNLR